jgi:hypothetical protein
MESASLDPSPPEKAVIAANTTAPQAVRIQPHRFFGFFFESDLAIDRRERISPDT